MEAHLSNVHLLPLELGKLLPVKFLHGLDNGCRSVDRRNVLVFFFEQVLAKPGSSAADHEDLSVCVLDCVGDNGADPSKSLVPIEELLGLGVAVLPIFLLSVLLHLLNN